MKHVWVRFVRSVPLLARPAVPPFLAALTLLLVCSAGTARAGEVLDNAKIINMMKKGVALEVILKLLEPSTNPVERAKGPGFRFDASSEAMIALQEAGKEGSWPKDDIVKLQSKVNDLAKKDEKMLSEMVDTALNIFENADPDEYASIMRRLANEGKRMVPYLLVKMEQESDRKRAGVLDALGRVGTKEEAVIRACTLMLMDRSKPVRLQAAKTVVALADESTAKELTTKLNSRVEKLDGVAMALGYLGDKSAVEPLTRVLLNSGDSDTRVCAAFALGELRVKNKDAISALLEAVLDEHDEKLRETAANALAAKLGEKRAPSYIVKAFQRYRTGREALLRNLSYIKDLGALDFLVEQVENDDPKIKKAAVETLVLLTGEEAKDAEEWRGIRGVLQARPDWIQANPDSPRIPDARREGTSQKTPEGATVPTSLQR